MGLGLLVLLYAGSAALLRLAAGGIGRRISPRTALVLALLPLPFVGGGFLPGKVLAPTNGLAGNAPWCSPEFLEAARGDSTAPNPLLFDPLTQGEPWRRATREGILFNPSAGSGAALLGNAQAAPLFLPELLGRLLPPTRAASWIQAARLLIAAFGMFLLARTLGMRRDAALIAAASFVAASFLQLWRTHALSSVAAMTPWVLAAVVRVARRPSRRSAVALGIVGAVAVSAGHPETLLQSAGLTAFAVAPTVLLALASRRHRSRGLRAVSWGGVAALLAGLLAAPVLLPFLETMRVSESWALREAGSLPPVEEPFRRAAGRLATAAQLLVRGDPISGTFTGSSNIVESGGAAAGAATLVLAAAALSLRRRRRFVLGWVALGVAGLLVSAHVPLVARVALLVPWLGHSILDRLGLWWVVSASLLAGLGSMAVVRRVGRRWALAGGAVLLSLLAFLAATAPTARRPLALGIELAGLAGLAAAIGLGRSLSPAVRTAAILAAVVLPRAAFFATWVPVSAAATFYPETPAVRFVRERAAGFRVAGIGAGLWPSSAAFFGLEDPRICDPMNFVDYARLTPWIGTPRVAAWPVIEDPLAPALGFLGVRYLFDGPDAPARPPLVEVYRGSDATVYENPAAQPRAFVPRRIVVARSTGAAADATRRLADPAVEAILTTDAYPEGTVIPNGEASLRELVVGRGRVGFQARVHSLALVATSQPAIPGWRMEVDGRQVQPVRVDTAFLGVVLAPGEHRVTVRYVPWTFVAGFGLFAAGLLATVALSLQRSAWRAVAALLPRGGATAFGAVAAALTALSLWLPAGLPLVALSDFIYDDALYVRLAAHVASGEWLGPYDASTLAKGPLFPIFIAVSSRLGMPLLLAGRLFFAAAALLLVAALAPVVRAKRVRLLLLAVLLLNPVVVTRAAREVVYPSVTLLALAGACGAFSALPSSPRRAFAWSALCGAALGAIWLTREEGVWILPPVALLLAAAVFRETHRSGLLAGLRRAGGVALLPFLVLGLVLFCVALANRGAYGVLSVRESSERPFLSAYGALVRIRPSVARQSVPVPEDVRRRAYAESPAFGTLEPLLEGEVGRAFSALGAELSPEAGGDIAAGWLQFALRDAASRTGRYRDARTAAAFWTRVADELNAACEAGRLECLPERHTMTPPGVGRFLPEVLRRLPGGLAFLASSVDSSPALRDPGSSSGSEAGRALFARLTRERLAPAPGEPRWVAVSGWAFLRGGGALGWAARAPDGSRLPSGVTWSPSGDVAAHLRDPEAGQARFVFHASCPGPCVLELSGPSGTLFTFDPAHPGRRVGSSPPALLVSLDEVAITPIPATPGEWERNERRRKAQRSLARGYRVVLRLALPAAVVILGVAAVAAFVRRQGRSAVVVAVAFLAVICSRVALLTLIEVTSFPALHYLYLSAAYPPLYAFVVLSGVAGWEALAARTRRGATAGTLAS